MSKATNSHALALVPAQPSVEPLEPQQARRQTKRDRALCMDRIEQLAAEACGGAWTRGVPWFPLRDELFAQGFRKDTIRRAVQDLQARFRGPRTYRRRLLPPKTAKPAAVEAAKPAPVKTDAPQAAQEPPGQAAVLIGLSPLPQAAMRKLVDAGAATVDAALRLPDVEAVIGKANAKILRQWAARPGR